VCDETLGYVVFSRAVYVSSTLGCVAFTRAVCVFAGGGAKSVRGAFAWV